MATTSQPDKLAGISPKAYEHPADRAATAALKSIPMLDVVTRRLIEFGYERAFRQGYLGASIKLGPKNLPDGDEIQTVLAHEVGHILSDHVMYRTALAILLGLTGVGRIPMLAGLPL